MENDGGKPDQGFPPAFRPGGTPVEGTVVFTRGHTSWRVLGQDASGARLFAKTMDGTVTGWLECRQPMEVLEMHSTTPVDVRLADMEWS